MKIQSKLLGAALAGALSLTAMQKADAVATIQVYEDAALVATFQDNGGGDIFNPTTGAVGGVYSSTEWAVTLSVFNTKPAVGSAASPSLQGNINYVRSTGSSASVLSVVFFDLDFTPSDGVVLDSRVSFNQTGGTATYNAGLYYSAANDGLPTNLLAQIPLPGVTLVGNDSFDSATASSSLPPGLTYSLAGILSISSAAGGSAGNSDFTVVNRVPDGGTTLAMLGLSLIGIQLGRRKLQSVA